MTTTTTTTTATWTKLHNGTWGARVAHENAGVGDTITIAKKSGEVQFATIDRVVWRGNGVTLAAVTVQKATRVRRSEEPSIWEDYQARKVGEWENRMQKDDRYLDLDDREPCSEPIPF